MWMLARICYCFVNIWIWSSFQCEPDKQIHNGANRSWRHEKFEIMRHEYERRSFKGITPQRSNDKIQSKNLLSWRHWLWHESNKDFHIEWKRSNKRDFLQRLLQGEIWIRHQRFGLAHACSYQRKKRRATKDLSYSWNLHAYRNQWWLKNQKCKRVQRHSFRQCWREIQENSNILWHSFESWKMQSSNDWMENDFKYKPSWNWECLA